MEPSSEDSNTSEPCQNQKQTDTWKSSDDPCQEKMIRKNVIYVEDNGKDKRFFVKKSRCLNPDGSEATHIHEPILQYMESMHIIEQASFFGMLIKLVSREELDRIFFLPCEE